MREDRPRRRGSLPAAGAVLFLTLACAGAEPPATGPAMAPWRWQLPAGFPAPVVPADNPMSAEKVALGRRLFYDRRLSVNGTTACATCHRQELAFTDGRPRARGATGELHPRSSMSLANAAYDATLTWASREIRTLEEQMLEPLFNQRPVEMGLAGHEQQVLGAIGRDPLYRELFARAFPGVAEPLDMANVVRAIACFERTLISGGSAWDRWAFDDDAGALSASARRGMELFFSDRLGCADCHPAPFFAGPARFEGRDEQPAYHNTGLYNVDGVGGYPARDRGLIDRTGRPEDMGRFRAPTLRNIAVTAPYMHDGSVPTLDEVIDHYAAGGRALPTNPLRSEKVRGFALSRPEREDLISFLESLTDTDLLTDPRLSSPFPSEPPSEPAGELGAAQVDVAEAGEVAPQ